LTCGVALQLTTSHLIFTPLCPVGELLDRMSGASVIIGVEIYKKIV
jgi:hypothetical protein